VNRLKKGLLKTIKNNNFNLSDYIEKKIKNVFLREKNTKELINLLPIIIENTNDSNCDWILDIIIFKNFLKNDKFLDSFINNINKFDFQNSNYLLEISLTNIDYFTKLNYQQLTNLIDKVLICNCKIDNRIISLIYQLISNNHNDQNFKKMFLKKYITTEKSCEACIIYMLKLKLHLDLLDENIDFILNNFKTLDLFDLKSRITSTKNEELINKINATIEYNKKENIITTIKNIYINHLEEYEDREYYKDIEEETLNINDYQRLSAVLEVIYLIIEDISKNEQVPISNMQKINSGSFSTALLLGNKVIKIGYERGTETFPNNPYINAILLRKKIPINEIFSIFIEVTEKVDTSTLISEEELYELYKKLRDIHLIWNDISTANVGRLLKDNKVYWREELPITSEVLNLQQYRGNEILKKGDLIILDNDFIYDENDIAVSYIANLDGDTIEKRFAKRYEKEQKLENNKNISSKHNSKTYCKKI